MKLGIRTCSEITARSNILRQLISSVHYILLQDRKDGNAELQNDTKSVSKRKSDPITHTCFRHYKESLSVFWVVKSIRIPSQGFVTK
jgi:hypothetical protein